MDVEVTDRFACIELRDRLGTDDVIRVLQQNRLRWYRLVSRKDKNGWVKMHGLWIRGCKTYIKTKETWREVVAQQLYHKDVMDHS